MSKRILNEGDPKLNAFYRVPREVDKTRFNAQLVKLVYDLILLKHLNAPADQKTLSIGKIALDTNDLVLISKHSSRFDLVLTRYAINDLKSFLQNIRLDETTRTLFASTLNVSTQRYQVILALEDYLNNPNTPPIQISRVTKAGYSERYLYVENEQLVREINKKSRQQENVVPRLSNSTLGDAERLVRESYLKRATDAPELPVKGVALPVELMWFGFDKVAQTCFYMDKSLEPKLLEIAHASDTQKNAGKKPQEQGKFIKRLTQQTQDEGGNKEWLSAPQIANITGLDCTKVRIIPVSLHDAKIELLKTPEGREQLKNNEGHFKAKFGMNGKKFELDIPIRLTKYGTGHYLIHRDFLPTLVTFLTDEVGIKPKKLPQAPGEGRSA